MCLVSNLQDVKYRTKVQKLASTAENCIKQNNTVNIYEEYFKGDPIDSSTEPPSAKGLAVFRDPNTIKRTATSINWNPDGNRIAVSYSILHFQDERMMKHRLPVKSYIWDISNPNTPERELVPSSPLVCLRYNHKFHDTLVGGSYNGLISVFDLKSKNSVVQSAVQTSEVETSHHDPVYDVFWIQSKTHKEFVSVSTDGRMLKWDMRSLKEPTMEYELKDPQGNFLGGSSMEYNVEGGSTKFLIGTEQGIVMNINTKKKGDQMVQCKDSGSGKHHGPICAIQRNPSHPKYFMTVGDWTARVWSEDNSTPIMSTQYCQSYLTGGCWSPTRAGVFFTTRMDGVVDVWDIYHRQNDVAYSHKVGDYSLSSIAIQGNTQQGGSLCAVGDVNGTVSLLEMSDSLARPQHNEKSSMQTMFERESTREKNLEKRSMELQRAKQRKASTDKLAEVDGEEMDDILRKVDAEFLSMIKDAEEEETKTADTEGQQASA